MIDVVITSDIRIYCEGLGQLLSRAHDINVTAIADDYDSAMVSVSVQAPEIFLLDMSMVGSFKLVHRIALGSPEIKIVALGVSYDESSIVRCAEAGVTCYVPREASVDELLDAIREAAKGECYCPPKIAACLLKEVQTLALAAQNKNFSATGLDSCASAKPQPDQHARLTRRERQIADLLTEGLSNKQIARDLCIEVSTVKNHVHNLLVKLEVKNRSQAAFHMQNSAFYHGSESNDLDPLLKDSS